MSQQSQRKSQKPKPSASQRPGTSAREFVVEEDETLAASQISPNKSLTNQEHTRHVANVVKYILAADHTKVPITKSAISKAVGCHNKNFRAVYDGAKETLIKTFGYDIKEVDGKLIVFNKIKNDLPHLEFEEEEVARYGLVFIILSHIFMSGGHCSQGSLVNFLVALGIISDGNMRSEHFGDVQGLITQFCKEKYLQVEKSQNSETDEPEYYWGARSDCELSPRVVMEFVSKVYRGRNMQSWSQQYERMMEIERGQNGQNQNDEEPMDE